MMRKKALVIIEPKKVISRPKYVSKICDIKNIVEINFLNLILAYKRMNKKLNICIISSEEFKLNNYSSEDVIYTKNVHFSENQEQDLLEQSLKIANQWYGYGSLPKLLEFKSVNIGEALQGYVIFSFLLPILRQIEVANQILEEVKPDILYIESNDLPSGKAFEVVAKTRRIKYFFMQPKCYRIFKNYSQLNLKYKTDSVFSGINLYHITDEISKSEKGNLDYCILYDVPYINYYNAISPVITELSNQGIHSHYIFGKDDIFSNKMEHTNIINLNISDESLYKEKIISIKEYYNKLKKDPKFQKLFIYKNVNIFDTIENDIYLLFNRIIPETIISLIQFSKTIDIIKPDILVLGSGDKLTAAVANHALLAKKLNIPILKIMHGLMASTQVQYNPIADKIAIGGDYWKKIYEKTGAKEEQLVVTGWPKFDIYSRFKNNHLSKYNSENEFGILFATDNGNTHLNTEIIRRLGQYIENLDNIYLTVKPHPREPSENTELYKKIAKEYKNMNIRESNENISELIARSELLINASSTVALEAALLDKPIININLENQKSVYADTGITIEINSLNEIVPAIENILYDEDVRKRLSDARREFVFQYAYIQDGKASERVADLILQLINKSKEKGLKNRFYR